MNSFRAVVSLLTLTGVAAFTLNTPVVSTIYSTSWKTCDGAGAAAAAATNFASSKTALHMATWSDPKAVKEYQNFLDTGKLTPDMARDQASVIIVEPETYCHLADALYTMGMGDDIAISPYQDLPDQMEGNTEYPIYITLPPNRIAEFLVNLPESYLQRADDFVFMSGGLVYGNIEKVLQEYGFSREGQTQVLVTGLRFTEDKRVQDIGVKLGMAENGEEKWGGQCTATGKWAGAISERMLRNDVICKADFYRDWRRAMWEASCADAIFHLLGVVREEPTSVANVAQYYYEEASDILWEISGQLRGWKALTLTYGFEERLYGVAEVNGADVACTVTDEMYPYVWGVDVFLQSKMFLEYLHYAQGQKGYLQGTALPPMKEEGSTIMRSGNMRADGVI